MKVRVIAFENDKSKEHWIQLNHMDLVEMTEGTVKLLLNQNTNRRDLSNFIENSLTFFKFEDEECLICEHKIYFSEYSRPGGSEILSLKDQKNKTIITQYDSKLW